MISHPRIPSRIQRERARVRSEPLGTTLTFYSPAKETVLSCRNAVFISVVSFRAPDCVKTPLMVREPHHELVVQLARSSTLTDRPEPSRRAPVELSHSLAQREILDPSRSLGMTTHAWRVPTQPQRRRLGAVRTVIGIEGISDRGCDNVLVFCAIPDFFHFLIG
jgi:hypothetical protein